MKKKNAQSTISTQFKKYSTSESHIPCCIEIIRDMVDGLGFSYSRIAKRIGVSPSTIQKLATRPARQPRYYIFQNLLDLYYKLFFSEMRLPQAKYYLQLKQKSFEVNKHSNSI